MPDISMCHGGECPQKATCHRHVARPNPYRQSYFVDPPYKEDGTCEYYWEPPKEDSDAEAK